MRLHRLILLIFILAGCADTQTIPAVPAPQRVAAPLVAAATATQIVPATATPPPTTSPPQPTIPPAPTSTGPPTASPTPAGPAQPRVGIQVGHWRTDELPDELARFRTSTGAVAGDLSELEVNLSVAERVRSLLEAEGIAVDLLPSTVPESYQADAFVSIHSDGSPSSGPRGFKMATPWRTSAAGQSLFDSLMAEYGASTGLPRDNAVTFNMRGYYAFSWTRHRHAIAKTTPAVIVELGYITNPTDRAFLLNNADLAASGVANGVLGYLAARDPADQAALLPPDLAIQRPIRDSVAVHASPNADAEVIFTMAADQRLMPFREQDGWYEGVVRGGWRIVGWVRKADMTPTDDPFPTPSGQ